MPGQPAGQGLTLKKKFFEIIEKEITKVLEATELAIFVDVLRGELNKVLTSLGKPE